MWQSPKHKDLPDWGKFLERGNTPPIWTCYANGRPNGMHCHGNLPEQKSNAHMDSPGNPDPDTYTILVNLNPEWRSTSGGEVIFHDADGYAEKIVPHKPGLVTLYSSDYIHRTIPNVVANTDERFQQKIAFRVRKK